MASLKKRLTDRRAKRRAARDERQMRVAMDPRTTPVRYRKDHVQAGGYVPSSPDLD